MHHRQLHSMLRALACACLLLIQVNASGSGKHPRSPPSSQSSAVPTARNPPRRAYERGNDHRDPASEHLEPPTRAPPSHSPKRRYSSRVPEASYSSTRRHRGRPDSFDVTIKIHPGSRRRDKRRVRTIRVRKENGNTVINVYNDQSEGDSDESSEESSSSIPQRRRSSRRDDTRSRRGVHARRKDSPAGRDDSRPSRNIRYSPVRSRSRRSPGRDYSPITREDGSESQLGRIPPHAGGVNFEDTLRPRLSMQAVEQVDKVDIASSPEVQEFVDAVQKGDLKTAWNVNYHPNSKLREYCNKHLASLGQPKLVELYKITKRKVLKAWVLGIVLVHAEQEFVDILNELKPDDEILGNAMGNADLACNRGRFISILKRITTKDDQVYALINGVEALALNNKLQCFDPLLTALRDDTSLDKELVDAAIRSVFRHASACTNERTLYARRFFDHPAVDAWTYSNVLYRIYIYGDPTSRKLFYWLLARADHQDLERTIGHAGFSGMSYDFQRAIIDALKVVRTETRYERKKRA